MNDSCLSFVMLNGQSVMFFADSSSSRSGYSTSKSTTYENCYTCRGAGSCRVCKGSGVYSNYGHTSTCSACEGTGKCWHCYGSGKQ